MRNESRKLKSNRPRTGQYFAIVSTILLLTAAAAWALSYRVGKPVPGFVVMANDGKRQTIAELLGKSLIEMHGSYNEALWFTLSYDQPSDSSRDRSGWTLGVNVYEGHYAMIRGIGGSLRCSYLSEVDSSPESIDWSTRSRLRLHKNKNLGFGAEQYTYFSYNPPKSTRIRSFQHDIGDAKGWEMERNVYGEPVRHVSNMDFDAYVAYVPFWGVCVVFGVYPITALAVTRLRRWRRRRAGCCLRCGYDLTGNVSGACPECGRQYALRAT